MFTTWTSANRIVTQPLTTTFTREMVKIATTNPDGTVRGYFKSYWLYTRIRRKKYKYIGMTRDTAVGCAMAMNLLYNRLVPAEWYYDDLTHIWRSYPKSESTHYALQFWKFMTCGVATILKDSKDDRYSVEIEVDEELPYRMKCTMENGTDWRTVPVDIWSEFEQNPDIVTPRFATGVDTGSDFTYDEET